MEKLGNPKIEIKTRRRRERPTGRNSNFFFFFWGEYTHNKIKPKEWKKYISCDSLYESFIDHWMLLGVSFFFTYTTWWFNVSILLSCLSLPSLPCDYLTFQKCFLFFLFISCKIHSLGLNIRQNRNLKWKIKLFQSWSVLKPSCGYHSNPLI